MFLTLTPVQEHLQGCVIFMTGATGFIGSAVLQKIFRTVPDIKRIYILVRPKRNKNASERVNDLCDNLSWEAVKSIVPNFKTYLYIIDGDLTKSNLGISEEAHNIIQSEVTHIFHIAATVRFDEHLKVAVDINIRATSEMLNLYLQCRKLKSVVHVSTAYSQCILSELEEKFYKPPTDVPEFLQFCEKKTLEELDELTPSLIGEFPNTYTFTKNMAESLINKYQGKLPICIVRPSIVMASWREPIRGWVNNLNGPMGVSVGIGYGLIHALYSDIKMKVDVVPVDMVANCIIAASWRTKNTNIQTEPIPIFNCVNSKRNPVSWGNLYKYCFQFSYVFPSALAVWSYFAISTKNLKWFNFLRFWFHTVPAYLVDTIFKLKGKKPMFSKLYQKAHHMQDVLQYFCDREWLFHDDQTVGLLNSMDNRDKYLFNFDITDVEYDIYFANVVRGTRIYLMKDPISTITAARRKHKNFFVLQFSLITLFLTTFGYFFYMLLLNGIF